MDLSSLFKKKETPLAFLPNYKESSSYSQQLTHGPVVTRIAPSPTGLLHIGTARSALFNYLFARNHNGKFIVRIEDTDKERSTKEFEKDILEGLEWLGISYDELYRQSERSNIYQSYIKQLLKNDTAYISKEESKKIPGKKVEVVRLRNPNKKVVFDDMLRRKIEFDTTELGDFVIARTVDEPLYHLAVVIDDFEMKITHVIRGEDHISNTPRQILIQEALGFTRPHYAHIPLILSPDRSKMSKRKGTAATIEEYRKKKYSPEAVVNYLVLLGWNPGTPQELFTLDELIKIFDITKIKRGGAIFDIEKLNWFNHKYIKSISIYKFKKVVGQTLSTHFKALPGYNHKVVDKLIPVLKEKAKSLSEVTTWANNGDLDYYFSKPEYEAKDLLWKDETDFSITQLHLQTITALIQQIPAPNFTAQSIQKAVWEYAEEKGKGVVLWPMRYSLSGKEKSPDPFTIAYILGKRETLDRLTEARNALSSA